MSPNGVTSISDSSNALPAIAFSVFDRNVRPIRAANALLQH